MACWVATTILCCDISSAACMSGLSNRCARLPEWWHASDCQEKETHLCRRPFVPSQQKPIHFIARTSCLLQFLLRGGDLLKVRFTSLLTSHMEHEDDCIWRRASSETRTDEAQLRGEHRHTDVFQLFSPRMETNRTQANRSGEKHPCLWVWFCFQRSFFAPVWDGAVSSISRTKNNVRN